MTDHGFARGAPKLDPHFSRVDKHIAGRWITLGYFSDAEHAARCARDGFGGVCRVVAVGGRSYRGKWELPPDEVAA